MPGLYIHIPFCRKACNYCNFYFTTSPKLKDDFVAALHKEIQMRAHAFDGEIVSSIYWGGGTPSALSASHIVETMNVLVANFKIAPDAEVTLEANPDDVHEESLQHWKLAGINRLSMGVQSFFDEDLRYMNRSHNTLQTSDCLQKISGAGFQNFSVDLIYGFPLLSNEKLMHNLNRLTETQASHISCYALTVEEKTALYQKIKKQRLAAPDEEQSQQQFYIIKETLEKAGYVHYEISNFALPGAHSRHNSAYWQQQPYLGFGPAAHSFTGNTRSWNIPHLKKYIDAINRGERLHEYERLTEAQQLNEYIMTGIRTANGCSLSYIEKHFDSALVSGFQKQFETMREKFIINHHNHFSLKSDYLFFADGIAAELFV